ncbi:MAG: DNA polymerase III subunit delta [Bacteroidia bacterium]|nr:DNA polymerase III subunit delta [Bacteroidia bacterium]
MTVDAILKEIKSGKFLPLYLLYGEEDYFLDKIVEAIDADGAALKGFERDFNREVVLGPETNASAVLNACQSFPVMAQRRLIMIKEAHRMNKKEWDRLIPYFKKPVPSTTLVILSKDKKAPFGKAGMDAINANGRIVESKKLYDRDVVSWVDTALAASGLSYDRGLPALLVTNLGTNLGLIEQELEKMFLYLKATKQTALTNEFVYSMINVDKEFNAFELVGAIAQKQNYKAHMIVDRLTQNTKINPSVLTINAIYRLFHSIALVHRFQLKDPNSIKAQLKANYYQALDYQAGSRNYNLARTYRNIGYIQEADLMIKGQVATNMGEDHILKTLVWRILN